MPDQGGRDSSPIIVRGLNTNSSGPGADGGTVATYVGEIPFFVDIKLLDIERVEVLIGPQGTLYGAGTLGGAIRYIPREVELDQTTVEVNGNLFSLSESDSLGKEFGFVFNTPLIDDQLGIRIAVNSLDDPGFIDYNYLVREGGVSLPDPDWSDSNAVADNITSKKDANGEDTLTAKFALRWTPNDWLDTTLTYAMQDQLIEGRSVVHYQSLSQDNPLRPLIGRYESAYRYEEPMDQKDTLLSLEVSADLGFADLVYAAGRSEFESVGNRDQTDLLIRLDYSYEEFPSFAAFTREEVEQDSTTHEIRLVSKGDSDLSWIVGGYYNDYYNWGESREFTPGYAEFLGGNRPDDLEYLSVAITETSEQALFGELSYQITDKFDITVGTRYYEYKIETSSAIDLPLSNTVFNGAAPDAISLEFEDLVAEDDGNLFKINTSYQFSNDVMGYATVSEGFRIGGANGVAACPDPLPAQQIVCALPSEQAFGPDTTTNYEIGFKTSWLSNRLQLNGAVFNVDWEDAQVAGATINGQQPITVNAAGAESSGFELSSRAKLTDELTAYFTYSYADAKLSADAPFLFNTFDQDALDAAEALGEDPVALQEHYDGKKGDRLPGAPKTQASLGLNYGTEILEGKYLDIAYGVTYQSDILTRVGSRANGEALPGYSLSNISAKISDEDWSVTFYVNNMFDKYTINSTRSHAGNKGEPVFASQDPNGSELLRSYSHFLVEPRKIGVKFSYLFDIQ